MMKVRNIIALFSMLALSCVEQDSSYVKENQIVVSLGEQELSLRELQTALPKNLLTKDSVEYAQLYINRWLNHQLKLREAQRIFSDSQDEIEEMVSAYRQALLTKKLDQYYIAAAELPDLKHEEIEQYYQKNKDHFRTQKAIVKGRILRMPNDKSEVGKIKALMGSASKDKRENFNSICEKRNDFVLEEFTKEWIDFDSFIAFLPIVQGDNNSKYMTKRGLQTLNDNAYTYIFEVSEYKRAGDVAPFEKVEPSIRRILTNDFHSEIICREEEKLKSQSEKDKLIKFYNIN